MQKAIEVVEYKRLYTSVFDYEGTIFVNQFYVIPNDLTAVLSAWSKLAKRRLILDSEARRELNAEFHGDYDQLVSMVDNKNAWWCFFLLNTSYLDSLVIVKTDQQEIGAAREKQKIWQQYGLYKSRYEQLKNVIIKTKKISKERKKSERLMRYWEKKKNEASMHQGDEQGFYTIVMEYNGDVFVYQFYISRGEPIQNVLKMWPPLLRKNKAFLEDEEDYILLEQKVQQEVYQLVPVGGLINVWSTYFMLRDGLGNIYVIKTDEEITPGG